jgi:transcriptional regulator GlxA family with amidase domain
MTPSAQPLHVSLVALPEAAISTLSGIFDVMNAFNIMDLSGGAPGVETPFKVEIVGEKRAQIDPASGMPINVQRAIADIDRTDVIIVPSVLLPANGWAPGRYPEIVEWLSAMHKHGAVLCSACSGLFLLAETGLFDGKDCTVHFVYAPQFSATYPGIPIHPERVLMISGEREELVTSGASMTWHDLVLYLIARYAGATAAQTVARMFALQWHQDGLAPYMVFEGRADHGDVDISAAQEWLKTHFSVASPVEEIMKLSNLPERTFKRRFTNATGLAPIAYIQRLRIEDAKRRLERTVTPIDEISWQVGYEDAAFFRRLFKRTTGLTPGAYRRRFRIPDFARSG